MKKTFKKLMAALLAVALLCAMAVPAFAADAPGSITINNAVSGKTYNVYRILDIATHNDGYTGIVYKTNDKWSNFINSTDVKSKYFTAVGNDGVITVRDDLNADDAKALAVSAKAWLGAHTDITADATAITATSSTVNFTNLELGYYLVVSSGWDEAVEVVCSLDTTKPDVEINEKNGKPTIEKKIVDNGDVDENTANIGDYVQFKLTVNVIDGKPTNYVIHDKMSTGLTFVNTAEHPVVVKVGTSILDTTQYSFNGTITDGCTFELKINDNILQPNDVVTVTYYGQVNSSAVINGDNTNEANLTYGTNGDSTWEKTTTKVFGFKVFKHAGTDTEHLLPGAEFRLYKTVGGETHYAKFDANGLLTGWTTGATDTGVTMTSNSDSALVLNGLDAGTYYLEEIKAPDGYNKLTAPVTVTITEDGKVNGTADGTVYVSNNAGATLPSTGGMGTTLFYVIGGGLMVAAVVLLVTKKRMENK
ncbi:MAG: SpaH/EbpB family LPXTG-anchored major pilin [Faecalibacterium sp.]